MVRPGLVLSIGALSLLWVSGCGGDVEGGTGGSSSGETTSSGAAGGTSSSATSASTTAASSSGSGDCMGCMSTFLCCDGHCANPGNDIQNCGGCGIVCTGPNPYCDGGKCGTPPCNTTACGGGSLCCDANCCMAGELCCTIPGPVGATTQCTPPSETGTCPPGCTDCQCASPDTPIATPDGERPISALAVGDLVYSADGGALRAVPIVAAHRAPVSHHLVVRVVLDTGRVLEISPKHPTGDGRTFADLRAGDRLDGARIVEAMTIPYAHDSTYDVLPASDTGTYVAAGVLIGSTLHGR